MRMTFRPAITLVSLFPILAGLGLATSCAGPALSTPGDGTLAPALAGSPSSRDFPLLAEPDGEGRRWVESTLASLTLEEAVGQLIFPWISGGYWAEDDAEFLEATEWVERYGIGGVAISIGTPHAYVAKLNALQGRATVPLLVTSDFENGGPGMRIRHSYALPSLLDQGGGTSFPPTMALGAIGDEEVTARMARITAREARRVGVHVNFAPVLDVNSNPENPIINTRAFGEDPHMVGRMGRAYIRGARAGGILTTAKHFPGHGDTRIDSHLGLPEVEADLDRLNAVEFVPFREAVAEGVDAIMTAHVSLPAVLGEGAPPATLSSEFMTRILREEMGFEGLLFTDALRMGAITDGYGAGEAAVLALEAGSDVILVPASVSGAAEAVVAAVQSGRISRERVDASVRRILEAKARVGLHRERMVPLEGLTREVGIGMHTTLAEEVAARALTLTRDDDDLVPFPVGEGVRVLSVTYAAREDLTAGREFDGVLRGYIPGVTAFRIGPDAGDAELAAVRAAARGVDRVVVGAYVPPRAGAGSVALPERVGALVRELAAEHPTLLISFGNPYLLAAVPEVGSYLLPWGDREVSQRAAARGVVGAAAIGGRLPITLPGLHFRGSGLRRDAVPAVVEMDVHRGDALDEAGLMRGGDDTPPPDSIPSAWLTLPISPLELSPDGIRRAGMDPDALDALDRLIAAAIADSVAPGVALAVVRRGEVVRLRGYGRTDWAPDAPAVTPFTLYDLASLTKVVGTTTAIALLVEEGRVELDAPVIRYLPGWDAGDARKAEVTVRDLLLHRGGLPPFRQFFLELSGEEAIREAVNEVPLVAPPGDSTIYSDIGFKSLAWVVEGVSGEPLDRFLERRVWGPLGMGDTGFLPDPGLRPRIAPTERDLAWRGYHIHGEVHDENAHALGGVAGHAGLFSTAQDLAAFAQALLARGMSSRCEFQAGNGEPCGSRSRPIAARWMGGPVFDDVVRRDSPRSSRTLGWDTPSGRSSAGDYFSASSFGHTGFTGTSLWVDPEAELAVVLLTNRVNPTRENQRHIPFRRAVHDAVATAVTDREVARRDP